MVNPQILLKDKLSLYLIPLTKKFSIKGDLWAFGHVFCLVSLFSLLSFSSSSFPPSHLVCLLGLGETELQGPSTNALSFCSPRHWQEMHYQENRQQRHFWSNSTFFLFLPRCDSREKLPFLSKWSCSSLSRNSSHVIWLEPSPQLLYR